MRLRSRRIIATANVNLEIPVGDGNRNNVYWVGVTIDDQQGRSRAVEHAQIVTIDEGPVIGAFAAGFIAIFGPGVEEDGSVVRFVSLDSFERARALEFDKVEGRLRRCGARRWRRRHIATINDLNIDSMKMQVADAIHMVPVATATGGWAAAWINISAE